MTRSRLIGLLLTLILGLGVVACSVPAPASPGGGAPPSGQSAPNNNAVAQQGVDNKAITIGLSSILSGPASSYSQITMGTKVYLDMVNRNGGVNGYTFRYAERDNAYQPAQGMAVAQQLVNEDKVFGLVQLGSPIMQALAPTAASLGTPILTTTDGDLLRPVIANVYGFNPRYQLAPLFQAEFILKNLHIKNIAHVYEDDALGRPGLKYLPEYVSNNGGKLVASLGYPADTTDWAPFATKLKNSGAEAVLYFGSPQLASLQKAADAIGYHPTWVGEWGILDPAYVNLAGPLAEGVYIDSKWSAPHVGCIRPGDEYHQQAATRNIPEHHVHRRRPHRGDSAGNVSGSEREVRSGDAGDGHSGVIWIVSSRPPKIHITAESA